jgi:hypothetical protein
MDRFIDYFVVVGLDRDGLDAQDELSHTAHLVPRVIERLPVVDYPDSPLYPALNRVWFPEQCLIEQPVGNRSLLGVLTAQP